MPSASTATVIGSPSRARHPARRFAWGAAVTRRGQSPERLPGPHERADELAVDGGDGVGTESGAGQKLARALGRVNPGRLHVDVLEPGLRELGAVLGLLERAGDAADPQLDATADLGRQLAAHDDVGDGEPSAGLQHAKRLGQHRVLVGGQVDDAVRDDDIYRIVREWDVLDLAL